MSLTNKEDDLKLRKKNSRLLLKRLKVLWIKKKLEGDINELEIALDHANKANSEAGKSIKRYQGTLRETSTAYEEEQRQRQEMAEKASLADRRANALQVRWRRRGPSSSPQRGA